MTEPTFPGAEAAERAAAMLTAAGMPRMAARVMMALVGSPDEGYSAAELAERLGRLGRGGVGGRAVPADDPHRAPALARRATAATATTSSTTAGTRC